MIEVEAEAVAIFTLIIAVLTFLIGYIAGRESEQVLACQWAYTTWEEVELCDSVPPWRVEGHK